MERYLAVVSKNWGLAVGCALFLFAAEEGWSQEPTAPAVEGLPTGLQAEYAEWQKQAKQSDDDKRAAAIQSALSAEPEKGAVVATSKTDSNSSIEIETKPTGVEVKDAAEGKATPVASSAIAAEPLYVAPDSSATASSSVQPMVSNSSATPSVAVDKPEPRAIYTSRDDVAAAEAGLKQHQAEFAERGDAEVGASALPEPQKKRSLLRRIFGIGRAKDRSAEAQANSDTFDPAPETMAAADGASSGVHAAAQASVPVAAAASAAPRASSGNDFENVPATGGRTLIELESQSDGMPRSVRPWTVSRSVACSRQSKVHFLANSLLFEKEQYHCMISVVIIAFVAASYTP